MGILNYRSIAKHQKLKEEKFCFQEKISQCRKKLKGGTFGIFQHPFCRKIIKQLKREPFGAKIVSEKKSRSAEKIERGDFLVSPCLVCYAGKQEKPFWVSSLGRLMQFGATLFCILLRTILVSSCGLKKKKVTIIVAFHFMKQRLKTGTLHGHCSIMRAGQSKHSMIQKRQGGDE